jgi:hypothetical protein
VNAREKEQYLREYHVMKEKGKPFFPYSVLKDSAMACIVMAVIIAMAIILGAELGPKADPTSTTVTPRPEWYFFFPFELLRVVKPAELVVVATVGIPTIWMALLFLLPFYDRNPERHPLRRPIATLAGITTIAGMAYLTIEGALAGSPTKIDMKVEHRLEPGRGRIVGLPRLPPDRRERELGAGAAPHRGRRAAAAAGDRPHAREPDRADALVRATPPAEPRAVRPAGRVPQLAQVASSG